MTRFPHLPTRILTVYVEALTGFNYYTVQVMSTPPYSLKAMSLRMASTVESVNRAYIPRMGWGEELPTARVQLSGHI